MKKTHNIKESIMGFTDWLGLGAKKNKAVTVKKIKEQSVDMGAMAAGGLTGAAGTLAKMIDQKNATTKVLLVQDGEHMTQVKDYALKMAQRLDCEIIALDVTEKPLQFSGERRTRESDRFMDMAQKNATQFIQQAEGMGVKVEHIMEIGNPEKVIARLSAADAGIRYVLSKPEGQTNEVSQERAHLPVIDLHCSRF
jgi:hypothetical protein